VLQTQEKSNHLNRNLSKDFKAREFICPCCGAEGIKDLTVFYLQCAHDLLPASMVMIVNSGYRCVKHNTDIGGDPHSSHKKGWAVDIKVNDNGERFLIIMALYRAGFKRIGIADGFIHADIDPDKLQKRIWLY